MFGNQQGPRPSAADTETREWEAVDKARRRDEKIRAQFERDDPAHQAGAPRRRWWWPFTSAEGA